MKILTLAGAFCAIAVQIFAAEDSVKIDNDQTRVLVVSSAPGAKSAMHEHQMNRVMIYLDAGSMALTDPKGNVETLKFKPGEALWSPTGGLHASHNLSGHPVRIVEVELKSKPGGASTAKPSELDPVKVDPKRYKVEMDNDQVRVIRARYEPHGKGVMHEHSLNRVVTFLTPGRMRITTPSGESRTATNTVGEVTWGGQAKHIEENLNDTPFEVLVVEFKK
jgi:quercetin dioxygenase-like cupin family protein